MQTTQAVSRATFLPTRTRNGKTSPTINPANTNRPRGSTCTIPPVLHANITKLRLPRMKRQSNYTIFNYHVLFKRCLWVPWWFTLTKHVATSAHPDDLASAIIPSSRQRWFWPSNVFAERVKEISSAVAAEVTFNGHCAQNCDNRARPVQQYLRSTRHK